jgi:hypothetical protein
MMEILIDPARRTGCNDLENLEKVIEASSLRQRSPLDDILDANVVDEEKYLQALAYDIGMEWFDPACGSPIAIARSLWSADRVTPSSFADLDHRGRG